MGTEPLHPYTSDVPLLKADQRSGVSLDGLTSAPSDLKLAAHAARSKEFTSTKS